MANVATLSEMLVDLRAELMHTLNPAQATQVEAAHKVKLQRVQRTLWQDYDWPRQRKSWDVAMAAGQRLYDLPTDLDLEKIEKVEMKWSGLWHPLFRGIGGDELSAYDSDIDVRSAPVMRWEQRENGQFEVWPVPPDDGNQTVRFWGIKGLGRFTQPGDFCTLDRDLIVLSAAAELATDQDMAAKFAARANALLNRLKLGGTFGANRRFNLNESQETRGQRWPVPPRVSRGSP